MQGTALGVAATFGIGDAATLNAPDPAIFDPPFPPPAGLDRQPARAFNRPADRPAAAAATRARSPNNKAARATAARRDPPNTAAASAAIPAAVAELTVTAPDDRQAALPQPPPVLTFPPTLTPDGPDIASMDRPFGLAAEPGAAALPAAPNFPLPLTSAIPGAALDAPSSAIAPGLPPFSVADASEMPAAPDGVPLGSTPFADVFKSVGSNAAAMAGHFPAFGDVSAAPWLGDSGAKRQALIEQADRDPAGEETAGETPTPDPEGGAAGATADGQAKEGDLLSLQTLSRGGLAFSGGYSSIEGPIGSVKIARTNIGAPGRDITASARYSKVQMLAEFGVSDSNFAGSKFAVAPTFFYSRSSAIGFDKTATSSLFRQTARGINLYVGRPLDRGLRVAANYRFSDEDFLIRRKNALCDVGLHGSPFCNALGRSQSSVASLSLSLDRRDSAVDPTRGFQLRVTQDVAGPGGTTRYLRLRAGGTFHRRLSGNIDVSLGLEGGYMKGFGGRDIPLFDRFYIGGTSMRGFDLRGLGPKVIPTGAAPGQTTAIGGSAYYVGRLEVSTNLGGPMDRFGVSPSVFVDAGSLFGAKRSELLPAEQLLGNSAKPRVAVGVGLSLNVAPGKLRFNIAHPVVRQRGDRSRTFSITFGTAF